MNVAIDANVLVYLLDSAPATPRRLRAETLLDSLREKGSELIVPMPALAEYIVGQPDPTGRKLLLVQRHVKAQVFDERVSEELGFMIRAIRSDPIKKARAKVYGWDRNKFDCSVIACAKVGGASGIVTNDRKSFFATLATDAGLDVLIFDELPISPAKQQIPLALVSAPKIQSIPQVAVEQPAASAVLEASPRNA